MDSFTANLEHHERDALTLWILAHDHSTRPQLRREAIGQRYLDDTPFVAFAEGVPDGQFHDLANPDFEAFQGPLEARYNILPLP